MAGRGPPSALPEQPIFQNPLTPMQGPPGPPPPPPNAPQRTSRRRAPEDPIATTGEMDTNGWYFPGFWAMDEFQLQMDLQAYPQGTSNGNWGQKRYMGSRFEKRKKMSGWGVRKDDWDADERARARIKSILPQEPQSPQLPTLPHLRSPSPPLTSPYPQLLVQHPNFSAFVMDESVQHSFRSNLINDLSQAIGSLIEGESDLLLALGRLWQAIEDTRIPGMEVGMNVDGTGSSNGESSQQVTPPDLNALSSYLFVNPPGDKEYVPNIHASVVEEGISFLKELQSDSLEYVERLEEIREGLGRTVEQREALWTVVRDRALTEMEEEQQE